MEFGLFMPEFDPVALREACTPKLYRRDMATKMGISCTYLQHMEQGIHPFAEKWKVRFMEELEKYKANPDPENQFQRRWRLYRERIKAETVA